MLSKNEIKKLRSQYGVSIRTSGEDSKVIKLMNEDDDVVGKMIIVNYDEGYWEVEDVDCSIKGAGKMLYYYAMGSIYPMYLSPDGLGCSQDAARIWKAFDGLDYVDKITNIEVGWVDKSPDLFYSDKLYRFKWKDE